MAAEDMVCQWPGLLVKAAMELAQEDRRCVLAASGLFLSFWTAKHICTASNDAGRSCRGLNWLFSDFMNWFLVVFWQFSDGITVNAFLDILGLPSGYVSCILLLLYFGMHFAPFALQVYHPESIFYFFICCSAPRMLPNRCDVRPTLVVSVRLRLLHRSGPWFHHFVFFSIVVTQSLDIITWNSKT